MTTRPDGSKGVMPHFIDRAKPGVIAVTPKGKRFTNEGNSYHDFVQDMVKATKGEPGSLRVAAVRSQSRCATTAWAASRRSRCRSGVTCSTGYLKRGETVGELAKQIGVEPTVLKTTVDDFNRMHARARTQHSPRAARPTTDTRAMS